MDAFWLLFFVVLGKYLLKVTLKNVFLQVNKISMASFESLYNKIEYNVKAALLKVADLQRENAELKEQNAALEEKQKDLVKQTEELTERLKLTVVTQTVLNKKDKKETKKQINDWVREIDKCINLLTNK